MDNSVIIAILSSGVLSSLVSAGVTIVVTQMTRKDKKLEREEEKKEREEEKKDVLTTKVNALGEHDKSTDETVESLISDVHTYMEDNNTLLSGLIHSNKLLMQDRIRCKAKQAIIAGKISYEERKFLHDMWDSYHKDLKGNGDLNLMMETIDALPLDIAVD